MLAAVVALAINLPLLGRPAPWRDEAATWIANQRSLPELFGMLGHIDAVHGLYYLLMRGWQLPFGDSVFSLRLASTVAVALTAGLLVLLGTALFGLGAGRWAGLGYGLLPQATWAAAEARSYALAALMVTLAFLIFQLAVSRGTWQLWIGYAVLVVMSAHVFLFAALAYVAVLPALAWLRKGVRLRAALATACAGLASIPFALVATAQSGQVAWLANYRMTFQWAVPETVWGGDDISAWLGTALMFLVTTAAVVAGVRSSEHRSQLFLVVGWATLPIALLALGHLLHPVFYPRYVTFTAPALALLFGWGVHLLRPWWTRVIALALLLTACLPPLVASRGVEAKRDSAYPAVTELAKLSRPGDGLFVVGKDPNSLGWAFGLQLAELQIVGADEDPGWRSHSLRPSSVVPVPPAPQWHGVRRLWLFADRWGNGEPLEQTVDQLAELGFTAEETIKVKAYYPVTLVLLERAV